MCLLLNKYSKPCYFPFQVKLERILGLTVPNNAALASAPSRGIVAYPAGCTVVLYSARKNRQSHVINPTRKTITSLAFSEDGRYMVTGECGHAPCVRIWDVAEKQQISEFPGKLIQIRRQLFSIAAKRWH